ncbi:MAG: cryptochrome [Candidatus Sumerlaeota bacterium]|nr:cryptochrome [Candidatus Sumerlaeota bacterium]
MSVPRAFPPVPNVPPGRIPDYGALGVNAPSPEPLAPFEFRGGEAAGFQRLVAWMWSGNFLRTFKETREGLGGADDSSLFSPWLSHGCLSPRFVYAQAQEYEKRRVANESTSLLVTELLRRDFFRFVSVRHGNRLFQGRALRLPGSSESGRDRERFEGWRTGATGIPFIDATMRELRRTGFLSSRGRQAAASYLVHDLGLDWRMGAEWFESQLIDYDPCSNYGNWQLLAGAGPDPSAGQRLDPLEQARACDPDAAYVKHWIPRLAGLPAGAAHTPWILAPEERVALGLRPRDYSAEPGRCEAAPAEHAIRR